MLYEAGLPGAGWSGAPPVRASGARAGDADAVRFAGDGIEASVALADGVASLRIERRDGPGVADARVEPLALPRIERRSPTLGAPPPEGAIVLFGPDRASGGLRNATDGTATPEGWLRAGATSREAFGSARIHLEFRTPFMPSASGQLRGNSGVYLQDRYEVQILDSFGNAPAADECGAIYRTAAPATAMALPPLQWQTYDIEFRAARFDASGAKRANARASVRHNGVLVHDDAEIPGPTGLGDGESPAPGALTLQDHWNPVVFRNVWVLPLDAASGGAAGPD